MGLIRTNDCVLNCLEEAKIVKMWMEFVALNKKGQASLFNSPLLLQTVFNACYYFRIPKSRDVSQGQRIILKPRYDFFWKKTTYGTFIVNKNDINFNRFYEKKSEIGLKSETDNHE